MCDERLPLVYVLSNGRSGSTLLDLLFGAHPEVWSVGEAQVLPWELREGRAPCGCGQAVGACPFWSDVLAELSEPAPGPPIEHFRESHGHGRVLRPGLLGGLLRGTSARRHLDDARLYGERNAELFEAVRRRASSDSPSGAAPKYLVDASKDPYRLLWLIASDRFDLRVIHLTKDPRAFTWSMTRGESSVGRRLRFGARWLVENALFARLTRTALPEDRVRRLRYEELAARPAATMDELFRWLELEPAPVDRTFRQSVNHCISGGRMRWSAEGIGLDQSWRHSLPASHARAVWALTWPLRSRLGYATP